MSVTRHPLCESRTVRKLKAIPIDENVISRLQRSFAYFSKSPEALVERFYAILFERRPELRRLFPTELSQQTRKLAASLAWVVANLRQTDEVTRQLHELGCRHVNYGAQPVHYPLVADALVTAMREVAAAEWSDDLEQEWLAALLLVGATMSGAVAGREMPLTCSTPR